jgi:hypothetical protein
MVANALGAPGRTLADGKALAGLLGLEDEFDPKVGRTVFRTRSTGEMPRLDLTFRWARAAGFVKVRHGSISATQRGKALGKRPTDDWRIAFEACITGGGTHVGRRADEPVPYWSEVNSDILEALPVWLCRQGDMEVSLLGDQAQAMLEGRFVLPEPGASNDPRRWIGLSVH